MGFENRKSIRVKLDGSLYFWPDGNVDGPGVWGRTSNVSATGLAFHSAQAGLTGDTVLLELTLPGQKAHLRLPAKVVHCERDLAGERHYQWRVNFAQLEDEARHQVRLYVLEVAEPDAGWGRAYFPGHQAVDIKYKELPAADREQWLKNRDYLSMKELVYLKNFQDLLEHAAGSRIPESLKVAGSRILKDGADVWMELDLPMGHLHFLGKVLWSRQDPGEKAETGLQLIAFHKEEALKLEKEF
jgi:hypothetical protein